MITLIFNVLYFLKMCPNFDVWYQIKPNCWKIFTAIFIDLWPCLFTTKFSYAQLFKWGHSKHGVSSRQSRCIEVAQEGIFLKRKIRFGLGGNTEKNWRLIMSNFWGKEMISIFFKYCIVLAKKIHKIKIRKPIENSCNALLKSEHTSVRDFYILMLVPGMSCWNTHQILWIKYL